MNNKIKALAVSCLFLTSTSVFAGTCQLGYVVDNQTDCSISLRAQDWNGKPISDTTLSPEDPNHGLMSVNDNGGHIIVYYGDDVFRLPDFSQTLTYTGNPCHPGSVAHFKFWIQHIPVSGDSITYQTAWFAPSSSAS